MKIIIDAFGGDFAPESVIKGAVLAKKALKDVDIVFSGNEEKLIKCSKKLNINISDFSILDAKDNISANEDPAKILTNKNESSMAVGLKALNQDCFNAFVSAGSTGALAVGSLSFVGTIKGVKRAALCPTIPCYNGKFLLVDAGANIQCRENVLLQFAIMGDIYARKILNIKNPKIGLANIGTEAKKGPLTHQAAFSLLKNNENLNFIGNVEARYIPLGVCDVVVADGLSGNMILKTMEGTAKFLLKTLKEIYSKNIKTKIASSLLVKEHKELKEKINYKNYGGAIFLGIKKPVIKAHGNSNEETFKKAIIIAANCVEQNIVTAIENNI